MIPARITVIPKRITKKITNWPAGTDECWRWGGAMSGSSPHIRLPESGQNGGVRALLLRLLNIPHGRSRSPRCRHKCCVNPWHIDPTYNSRAREWREGQKSPIRFARERNVCRWEGHPLIGRNIIVIKKKNGQTTRRCRLCAYRNLERNGHTTMPGAIARLEKEIGEQGYTLSDMSGVAHGTSGRGMPQRMGAGGVRGRIPKQ